MSEYSQVLETFLAKQEKCISINFKQFGECLATSDNGKEINIVYSCEWCYGVTLACHESFDCNVTPVYAFSHSCSMYNYTIHVMCIGWYCRV